MKKTILFVILEQYADWEAAYLSSALYMLGQAEYEVKTVSLTEGAVRSIGGFRALPDYTVNSVPDDYEALVLVGGLSWREKSALQVKPLVEQCLEKGRILAGICDASVFLGACGVLNDGKHTSNDLNDLKTWSKEAYTGEKNYVLQPAVSDRNIITANGTAPLEFAKEVLLTLKAAPEDKIMEWFQFHKQGLYNAPLPKDVSFD